jgi:hypothetical protein
MVLLVLAGRAVQRQAGTQHFVYIFLVSAWAGSALTLTLTPDCPPIVGASGGVMGIIGSFAALFPEYDLMRPLRPAIPLRLKAKYLFPGLLMAFVVLELVTRAARDAAWPALRSEAHLVHAGGLLTGWLYGRRLAAEGVLREWNDFFPLGLRRRRRESDAASMAVAGSLPKRRENEVLPALPAPPRELSDSEFLRERVDPVLEKLYANGADTLTEEERAVLEEASRRFGRNRQ